MRKQLLRSNLPLTKLPLTHLATKLSQIAPDTTFYSSATPPPHPTLFNATTGSPITSVSALKALCEQACFGLDGKTVTDLSVRKTLRAGPGVVSVAWPQQDFAAKQAGQELNLLGDVTAELHDVLLYEPGDFFKPHVDTKKHLRHQATMVVEVGLDHERCVGGMLATATGLWKSTGAGSFAAWVTNVEHEVTPVLSGQRVVATYKLLVDPATSKPEDCSDADPLVLLLRRNAAKYLAKFEEEVLQHEIKLKKLTEVKAKLSAKLANGDLGDNEKKELESKLESVEIKIKIATTLPKEFVAFWLARSYSTDAKVDKFSHVPISNLNGADRLLHTALMNAYDCPAKEVQVLPIVQRETPEHLPPSKPNKHRPDLCGDFLEEEETAEKRLREEDDDDICIWDYTEKYITVGYHYEDKTLLSGQENERSCFVDGEAHVDKVYRGHYAGNDAGEPVYTYHKSYIRVPVSRLKKWAEAAPLPKAKPNRAPKKAKK